MLHARPSIEYCNGHPVEIIPTGEGTYFEVGAVGEGIMGPIYGKPDTATILNLEVDPKSRGAGVGFAIFKTAVEQAKNKGFQSLQVQAGNERTAGYFSLFDSSSLRFALRNSATGEYEEADMCLSGALQHLEAVRQRLFPENLTCELPKNESVIINAPMNAYLG